MKAAIGCLIGLVFVVSLSAEPLLEGRVRLESGEPVADAQVRIFDLSDLRQGAIARALTDGTGYFALPLAALGGRALPERFALGPNYPNPFNPSTIIPYQLAVSSQVQLEVFNLLGQRIATLVDEERPAGFHTATWHATDGAGRAVAAGVYIYRMTVGQQSQTGRMVLIDGQAGRPAAGSGGSAAAVEAAGEAAPVYGLTVSGPGLVSYVNPAFRVEAGQGPVDFVVAVPGSTPRAKVAAAGILGDVDNNAQVDLFDALLVALYSGDASLVLPNHGAISLGDVNADGQVDLSDAGLISAYGNDPSDPSLPAGLGKRVSSATASLSPDPSTVSFADDGIWHPFTVQASESVSVVVNPGATRPRLELTTRSGRDNYCPGGADDAVSREDGEAIYLSGCAAGTATVELRRESDDTVLQTYTFTVTASPADLVVSASVSASSLTSGQSFTLSATVRNQGTASASATTLRYYRSSNRTISWQDTQVGSDAVSALAASATSAESISLTAPSDVGTYYYGACVERKSGESAGNNCSTGVRVIVEADETPEEEGSDGPVSIPDANLRAVIEAALGKASGATITVADMKTLTRLVVQNKEIRDLTGLESASNLTRLDLGWEEPKPGHVPTNSNEISDLAPLSGLTQLISLDLAHNNISNISVLSSLTHLTSLDLEFNNISDVSALAGMTNLTSLRLDANNITDISSLSALTNMDWLNIGFNNLTDVSPLSGLTKLTGLWLNRNNITDVSALAGMTNLVSLDLEFNNITDVSALASLTNLVFLDLRGNPPLSDSTKEHIAALESSGVTVRFDRFRKGEFDIELVFSDDFTEAQKIVYRYVARRWMAVIEKDLPDYEFTKGWSGLCGDPSFEIPAGERIDDLRIYVTSFERDDDEGAVGYGGPSVLREESHLPVVGCMTFSLERPYLWITGLHEVGHVLGFSSYVWDEFGYLQDPPNGDRHFNGPLAIAAFDDADGRDYSGAKVPLDPKTNSHWRYSVLAGEVMGPYGGVSLSAITVQSLADLGYGVDVTQADAYTLPSVAAGKASAKITAAMPAIPGVDVTQADAYALLGDDPHWQGRIAGGLPLLPGDDRLRGRLESAEWIGGRGFDLRNDRLMGRLAPSPRAMPKPLCGVDLRREPIYVIDPQGRIIRTLGH